MTAKKKAIKESDNKKNLKEKIKVIQALKDLASKKVQTLSSEQQNHINDCIFQIESDIKLLDKIEKEFKFRQV